MKVFFLSIWTNLRKAYVSFVKNDGFNLAASLAFFAILSAIPLILLLISVLGHRLGSQEWIVSHVREYIEITLPHFKDELDLLLEELNRPLGSGIFGSFFLVLGASLWFHNLQRMLDRTFRKEKMRNFWQSRLISILLLVVTLLLFFLPSKLSLLVGSLPGQSFFGTLSKFFSAPILYLLAHSLIFFLILSFVPRHSVKKRYSALG
ncbi:MAG: YihY/virulence factor BrkB family protein, partial [Deltaproteobacteria bacterium]|nr:YihY/virulence factor BrkB family protein [Deltaproteobacteria bacterium]